MAKWFIATVELKRDSGQLKKGDRLAWLYTEDEAGMVDAAKIGHPEFKVIETRRYA